jgi:PAS domain S-box-containing protein
VLDAFFCSATAGLAIFDDELRYVRINETLAAINGIPVEEHIGRTVLEILPELGPSIELLLRSALQTGHPILNRMVTGATSRQHGIMRSSYSPIFDAQNRVVGVSAVVVEITEPSRGNEPSARHSEDYRSVCWFGEEYVFSPNQAACVRVLWEAWNNQTPYLADGTVLVKAGVGDKQRLRDVFKKHSAWGTMIVQGPQRDTHFLRPITTRI